MSFLVIGSWLCFTHLSNIRPKGLSFGIHGVFPIFISLVTPKHKRRKQIPTQKVQTNSSIDAHETKMKTNKLVPELGRLTLQNQQTRSQRTSSKSDRGQQQFPPGGIIPGTCCNRVPQSNKLAYPVKKKPRLRGEYVPGMHARVTYPTKLSLSTRNTKGYTKPKQDQDQNKRTGYQIG